jgi:hypothetical protein
MPKNSISICTLWKTGELDRDIELNIIRTSIVEYCKIYDEFIQIREQGYNYTRAVELTADRLCLSESKVKMAIAEVI